MTDNLPLLIYEDLVSTRDYIQDASKSIGALQRLFIEPLQHDWQYGLEVMSYGLQTQSFALNGEQLQPTINLQTNMLSVGVADWNLQDYSAPELHKNIQSWLVAHDVKQQLELPTFSTTIASYDELQASQLLNAFNWLRRQFTVIKAETDHGLTSPVLIYPHHFDLSLVWFPYNDNRQVSLGFSTGDSAITEPYLYSSAYPAQAALLQITLPEPAYWHHESFEAAILRYSELATSSNPAKLLHDFAHGVWGAAEPLLTRLN